MYMPALKVDEAILRIFCKTMNQPASVETPQPPSFPPSFPPSYPPTDPPPYPPFDQGYNPLFFLYLFRTFVGLLVLYAIFRLPVICFSIKKFVGGIKLKRLLFEERGVEGCCWFAKDPTNVWHPFSNIIRTIVVLIFAPLLLFLQPLVEIVQIIQLMWMVEHAQPFDAILAKSPGDDSPAVYEATAYKPRWLLQVRLSDDQELEYEQVSWSEDVMNKGYTAISYPVISAQRLFEETQSDLPIPSHSHSDNRHNLTMRQVYAERLLFEYVGAKVKEGVFESEYIWLDEFCISGLNVTNRDTIIAQRKLELGRMADIFGGATRVCIFCHEQDCDHTSLKCPWGKRVFTLAEILHANKVVRMTRRFTKTGELRSYLRGEEEGRIFRRDIQNAAEASQEWHLHAVMQHTANAGAFTWQASIHALVVEIMRRDVASKFVRHNYLGKALNGLLPRRARAADIRGHDGWSDLAWLLELNQGFYNAASLAAICSLRARDAMAITVNEESDDSQCFEGSPAADTDVGAEEMTQGNAEDADANESAQARGSVAIIDFLDRHPWLGKPIFPSPGTERLEPIVTAIPVRNPGIGNSASALNIVGPQTIVVYSMLKRDANGFYRNDDMSGLRILSLALFVLILWVDMEFVLRRSLKAALYLMWMNCVIHGMTKLAVGTMYLKREGWVYLSAKQWGKDPQKRLGAQDYNLIRLAHWGNPENQAVPDWHAASYSQPGTLVDLGNQTYTRVNVTSCPNSMIPIAIHGSGITCMLLDRPKSSALVAERVGMANLPTFVMAQASRTASVCIGQRAF